MASLLRVTVQLQQAALRLLGLLGAAALGVYLIFWAVDPPPHWLNTLVFLWLLVQAGSLGRAHFSKRANHRFDQVDLGFFATLTVLSFLVVLQLPGGLDGTFYSLLYVLMMASAAYSHPASALGTAVFAGLLESGLRTISLGQTEPQLLLARGGFLVLFSLLNILLFRAEIARVRQVSRNHVAGELDRLRQAARSYRLARGSAGSEPQTLLSDERALQSAAAEIQQAVLFSLRLLVRSLQLQTGALLTFDGKAKLRVFEAVSAHALTTSALDPEAGILAAALDRAEAISISGRRAASHAVLYREPEMVGALCVLPLYDADGRDQERARAVLVVDRKEAQEFNEADLELLNNSGRFLLRAMENERVFAALRWSNREQGKLYRAAAALGSARTEAEVIEVSVESAREVAAFDFAAVTLFHKKGSTHEICAVSGMGGDELVGQTFRHNAGLVSMSVANGTPLPYRGEYDAARQTVFSRGQKPPTMPSLLVLPLLVHGRALGTLVLGSSQAHAFSDSVRPGLEVLASHMAISLSNARMLKRLEEQATTDGMTGLLNKRTLIVEAQRRIKSAARFKKPLSLLVSDIDHFKKVNDTYGHDVGDVVIKGLGEVLRRIKRDTDIVGRFGGEEFVIVCEQTDEEGATNLAERIRRELENTTFQTELGPLSVTCSVGVAPFPSAGHDWESLFKATDEALYVSKRAGRNRVTVWKPGMRSSAA